MFITKSVLANVKVKPFRGLMFPNCVKAALNEHADTGGNVFSPGPLCSHRHDPQTTSVLLLGIPTFLCTFSAHSVSRCLKRTGSVYTASVTLLCLGLRCRSELKVCPEQVLVVAAHCQVLCSQGRSSRLPYVDHVRPCCRVAPPL